MNFGKIESWAKGHWLFSSLLTVLFLFGLIFQTTDTVDRICSTYKVKFCSSALDYQLVSIHLDNTEHSYEVLSDGPNAGHTMISITASEDMMPQVSELFENAGPNEQFVFRIRGTGTANAEGQVFGISEHDSISGSNEPFVLNINLSREQYPVSSFMIHFLPIDPNATWDLYQTEPANCCVPYFEFLAYVRLSPFREKMQFGTTQQYRAKSTEPTVDVAVHAKERFDRGADFNHYFGGEQF